MDNDKIHELIDDAQGEGSSNCCGAKVYNVNDGVGICGDCKEYCEVVTQPE